MRIAAVPAVFCLRTLAIAVSRVNGGREQALETSFISEPIWLQFTEPYARLSGPEPRTDSDGAPLRTQCRRPSHGESADAGRGLVALLNCRRHALSGYNFPSLIP